MRTRLIAAILLALGILSAGSADAIMLTLGPRGPELAMDQVSALYASRSDGRIERIAQVGTPIAGGKIDELGVPYEMPDGRVLFGADIATANGTSAWTILLANPDAAADQLVSEAIATDAASPQCTPRIVDDPRPIADPNGTISFIASAMSGGDAIFQYREGEFRCIARTGDRTAGGDVVRTFQFGSLSSVGDGLVVMNAFVRQAPGKHRARMPIWHNDPTAIILGAPGGPIRVIAVEGERAPGGGRFGALGTAAAAPTPNGPRIAFTDASAAGRFFYVYDNQHLRRVTAYNARTAGPAPTWLSLGRPALAADGSIALRAATGEHVFILRVGPDGETRVVTQVGEHIAGFGHFDGFTDPIFAGGGALYFSASNARGEQALFSIFGGGVPSRVDAGGALSDAEFEVGLPADHTVAGTTMSVTASGALSYLGSSR